MLGKVPNDGLARLRRTSSTKSSQSLHPGPPKIYLHTPKSWLARHPAAEPYLVPAAALTQLAKGKPLAPVLVNKTKKSKLK